MPKPKIEKDTSERWLLTYSDLMNLLLILFIILYCSSQLNAKKAQAVSESLNAGFGNAPATDEETGGGSGDGSSNAEYWTGDEYEVFYNEVTKLINEKQLSKKVETKLDDTGVILSFKDTALFQTGSAELSDSAIVLIDEIGSLLYGLNYSFILVEGHTDSDPISNSDFIDNMDLSTQRAGNVWRELVRCGLVPDSMASIGYGEFRPIAANDSAENKAKNRRVVITILKKPFESSADISTDDIVAAPSAQG